MTYDRNIHSIGKSNSSSQLASFPAMHKSNIRKKLVQCLIITMLIYVLINESNPGLLEEILSRASETLTLGSEELHPLYLCHG